MRCLSLRQNLCQLLEEGGSQGIAFTDGKANHSFYFETSTTKGRDNQIKPMYIINFGYAINDMLLWWLSCYLGHGLIESIQLD